MWHVGCFLWQKGDFMKKFPTLILLFLLSLLLSSPAGAGTWLGIDLKTTPYRKQLKPLPVVSANVCSQQSQCSGGTYCWQGQCRGCTNPVVTPELQRTGYVRCNEGYCHNAGAAVLATIFTGRVIEATVVDCAEVPPPPPRDTGRIVSSCGTDSHNAATQIMAALCMKVVGCFPRAATCEACRDGIVATRQLGDEFGVPGTDGDEATSWGEIIAAVDDGRYVANPTHLAQCLEYIRSRSCTGPASYTLPGYDETVVSESYRSDFPTNFENLEGMLGEESVCARVFSAP